MRPDKGALQGAVTALALLALAACSPAPDESEGMAGEQQVSMKSVADRVVVQEDRQAILRLQRAYGFYISKGDWDAVADLFASDGVMAHGSIGHAEGRDAIRTALHEQPVIGGGFVDGVMAERFQLQPVIVVEDDGEHAVGRWREWIMQGTMDESAQWGDAINEVRYIKQDGIWQIASLTWHERFLVDYDGGWTTNRSVNSGRSDDSVWPEHKPVPYPYSPDEIGRAATVDQAGAQSADELRVAYLEDAEAIEDLLSAFGYYLDNGDWSLAASLFSQDGTAERAQRGVYIGPERIASLFALDGPDGLRPGQLNNHIQIQAVIHIAPDRSSAWSRSRVMLQTGQFGEHGEWGDAVVENVYRIENGRWRIARHRFYPTFISDYDQGFVAGARPLAGVSDALPPDQPPTLRYGSLPEVFTPPWHYAHPVTGEPFDKQTPMVTEPRWPGQLIADSGSELHARLTRLEDIRSVTNLQRSYGFIVDKALWQETSQLFVPHGTMEIGGRGVFVGPERIHYYYTFLGASGPQYGRLINHIQLQPLVTVDDDGQHAYLHSHFLAQGGDLPSKEAPPEDERGVQIISYLGTGWYSNRYVKDEGVWKIETLYGLFRMYTFLDKGWGRFALPSTRPETKMPPDLPPTEVYDLYPTTWFPVEHFVHPVTGQPPTSTK